MSIPPNSSTFMAQTIQKFFECWLAEQNQHLQELVSVAKDFQSPPTTTTTQSAENGHYEDPHLRALIGRVVRHYEQYYRAKSSWAKRNAISMFTPSWRSTLEDAFLWMGGWRPTMAFHLLYSKSGLQLEAKPAELICGLHTCDLGYLSPTQMRKVDDLQQRTIREENEISEKMAKNQESVADSSMVEMSNAVSEIIRNDLDNGGDVASSQVQSVLEPKKEGLEEILHMADELRLRTLKEVLAILTPIQAVHFLIAAAELHLRFHDWGKQHDAAEATHPSGGVDSR